MPKPQVSREDWTNAALEALAEEGVAAVRVDVLAKRLGVTRGSFYWHFRDRDALLSAALEEWERICTTEFIVALREIPQPREQLHGLLVDALAADSLARIEPALVAHADHPLVAPVLRRVTTARLDYLTETYRALGRTPADARRQAVMAYATYVGWLELRRSAPTVVPEVTGQGRRGKAALDHVARLLI